MKLMFLMLPLVYIAGNAYLYWRILQAVASLPLWARIVLSMLFWTAAFALFMSMGLRNASLPAPFVKALYLCGSVWMAFLMYSVLLLFLFDLLNVIVRLPGQSVFYALPLTLCLLVYGYVNYRNPQVRNIDISLEKNLSGDGLTAVAISDIHLGYGTGVRSLRRYADIINAQNPDVVFIVGDLIDNSLEPVVSEPFAEALNSIEAPMGIYMVPGNHEYISDIDACIQYLSSETSIHLLRDTVVSLPNGLYIIGRDDRSNSDRRPLEDLLAEVPQGSPTLVLDHQPYGLAQTDSLGVDVQISGHTHHGQLWPLNILVDKIYEQGYGYRKWSHSHIYVSSGLSLWGPPFRIGTESDLAVIRIRAGQPR